MRRRSTLLAVTLTGLAGCAHGGPAQAPGPAQPPAAEAPPPITVREAPRPDAPALRTRDGRWTRGDGEWIWVSDPAEDGSVVLVAVPDAPTTTTAQASASGDGDEAVDGAHADPEGTTQDPRLPPPAARPGDLELRAGSRADP